MKTNHSISVDCVVFGFDGKSLKVLLVQRDSSYGHLDLATKKLPGRMIFENESLSKSASRVLEEMTGLSHVPLTQFYIFSDPTRVSPEELNWINKYHGINTDRVVTVAYYGLVKLDDRLVKHTNRRGAFWVDIDSIRQLGMDHKEILSVALSTLCRAVQHSPVVFDLLPRKFTLRQLQNLIESIFGIDLDNRNFRKKILSSGFLIPTGEREKDVAHKPAEYHTFDHKAYKRSLKEKFKLNFVNNWS